jgi:hypothetical protein
MNWLWGMALWVGGVDMPAPPTPPAQAAPVQFEVEPYGREADPPLREQYPGLVGIAWGFNSTEALGLHVGHHLTPHWVLEGGVGVGLTGLVTGLAGRFNLLSSSFTPYISLGSHLHVSGDRYFYGDAGDFVASGNSAGFADASLGLVFLRPDGLSTQVGLGWSQLYTKPAYRLSGVNITEEGRRAVEMDYGGGLLVQVVLGYAY